MDVMSSGYGYTKDLPPTVWLRAIGEQYGVMYYEDINGDCRRAGLRETFCLYDEFGRPEPSAWQWLRRWGVESVAFQRDGFVQFVSVEAMVQP